MRKLLWIVRIILYCTYICPRSGGCWCCRRMLIAMMTSYVSSREEWPTFVFKLTQLLVAKVIKELRNFAIYELRHIVNRDGLYWPTQLFILIHQPQHNSSSQKFFVISPETAFNLIVSQNVCYEWTQRQQWSLTSSLLAPSAACHKQQTCRWETMKSAFFSLNGWASKKVEKTFITNIYRNSQLSFERSFIICWNFVFNYLLNSDSFCHSTNQRLLLIFSSSLSSRPDPIVYIKVYKNDVKMLKNSAAILLKIQFESSQQIVKSIQYGWVEDNGAISTWT